MRSEVRSYLPVVGVAFLCVALWCVPYVFAAPHMQSGVPSAGDADEILDFLVERYSDRPYIGVYSDGSDLSLGEFVTTTQLTSAFYEASVTESLQSEIVAVDVWVAPVLEEGDAVAALEVMGDGDPSWTVTNVFPAEFGQGLASLEPGDRVLRDPPSGMWFVVRGENALPLDEYTSGQVGGVLTLSELQGLLHSRYEPFRALATEAGAPPLGGSGGDVDGGALASAGNTSAAVDETGAASAGIARRPGLLAFIALACVVLVVALVVRGAREGSGGS